MLDKVHNAQVEQDTHGWRVGVDARGKHFAFWRNGEKVAAVPPVYQDVLDRVMPIQRGMMLANLLDAVDAYCITTDQRKLMLLQTYAMIHCVNDDPEATIPLKRI